MSGLAAEQAEKIVAGWRRGVEEDSPAGPLFASGYGEFDVTMTGSSTMAGDKTCIVGSGGECLDPPRGSPGGERTAA